MLFIIHFHTRRTVHSISSIQKADSRRGRATQAGILTQVSVSQLKASKPDIPSTLRLQTKDQKQHEHQYAALRPLVLAADRHLLPHHPGLVRRVVEAEENSEISTNILYTGQRFSACFVLN